VKPEKKRLKGEKKSDEKETDLERINAREPVCEKQQRKGGTRTKSHHRALFSSCFFFARSECRSLGICTMVKRLLPDRFMVILFRVWEPKGPTEGKWKEKITQKGGTGKRVDLPNLLGNVPSRINELWRETTEWGGKSQKKRC